MPKKELPPFERWPFRAPRLAKTIQELDGITSELRTAPNPEEALKAFRKRSRLMDAVQDGITQTQVLFSLDTKNKKYAKAQDQLNEELPLLQAADNRFQKAMLESPHRAFLEKKLGTHLFQIYEYSLKAFDESIVEESIEENKLTTEYASKLASLNVSFRGEEYNLPQMGKFLHDVDRSTRKEASEAYYAVLEAHAPELEEIYDRLVHVRDKMAKKLGYANYVELGYLRMSRYDYSPEDVKGYREQIRLCVTPFAEKIYKKQFKRTGIRKPESYDLGLVFKQGNPLPKGTTQEKVEKAKGMYDELSDETGEFFRFMADHHLLDLDAKPGKQSGGYMTYFPKRGAPFIFSNFNGTSGDVDVLTHEFGHSFQAYAARKIKIPEYRSPTMEACEIDSMSMEFFAHPWMERFFDQADKYRYAHLADAVTFLPYGVTVDHFQEWVYAHPNASALERDAKWKELEDLYTPYLHDAYSRNPYLGKGRRWLTQAHIFEMPFYYIDYTLAQVIAFQFFLLDRKNHELAWNRYVHLCADGGKYPFRSLVMRNKMKDPFAPGVVGKTVRPLMKVLDSYSVDEKLRIPV